MIIKCDTHTHSAPCPFNSPRLLPHLEEPSLLRGLLGDMKHSSSPSLLQIISWTRWWTGQQHCGFLKTAPTCFHLSKHPPPAPLLSGFTVWNGGFIKKMRLCTSDLYSVSPTLIKSAPPSQRCKIKTLLSIWSTAVAVVCVLPFWEDRGQSWRCWLLHSCCCSRCPSRVCHGSCPLYPLHVCFWLSKQQAGDLWRAWRMDAGVFLSADSYQEPCSTDLDVSNLQNLHQYICDHGNIIS